MFYILFANDDSNLIFSVLDGYKNPPKKQKQSSAPVTTIELENTF